jgi:RNA polymerase sigma-70 factor (ECF subfamily)
MSERGWLTEGFEANRTHLRAVAYRMLGSTGEADDAVQEAWLRLNRTDPGDVENLGGWLTTVVARVCLDMLRTRRSRREELFDDLPPERDAEPEGGADPEREALLADTVGLAMQVVLDTLTPAERVSFVLHDMFGVPFEEIATIVGRSPEAARQLASRARRRVGSAEEPETDPSRQRAIVEAFLAAARGGEFEALLALLDPKVVARADESGVAMGAAAQVRGAAAVAKTFAGRARAAQPALVGGVAGLVWAQGGEPRVVFEFTIWDGRIVGIDLIADPERIRELDVSPL